MVLHPSQMVFFGSALFATGDSASKAKEGPGGDPFISPRFQVIFIKRLYMLDLTLHKISLFYIASLPHEYKAIR